MRGSFGVKDAVVKAFLVNHFTPARTRDCPEADATREQERWVVFDADEKFRIRESMQLNREFKRVLESSKHVLSLPSFLSVPLSRFPSRLPLSTTSLLTPRFKSPPSSLLAPASIPRVQASGLRPGAMWGRSCFTLVTPRKSPSPLNPQPSSLNLQPSDLIPQCSTLNPQP